MPLLGIVAYFIDKNGKLQLVLLGLPRLRGLYSAENVATALVLVI